MAARDLAGRVAVVTGAAKQPGAGIATALAGAGAAVHRIEGASVPDDVFDFDVLIHAWWPADALVPREVDDVDDARFEAVWEVAMRAAIHAFQRAFRSMAPRGGGRIVVVTPTLSMSGAAGYVPFAAAVEGVRVLAKSAARQWGAHGITVNCLAPGPPPDAGALSLAPPALGRAEGDPVDDVGPVAVFLTGPGGHFITGATLCVDGGIWMSP